MSEKYDSAEHSRRLNSEREARKYGLDPRNYGQGMAGRNAMEIATRWAKANQKKPKQYDFTPDSHVTDKYNSYQGYDGDIEDLPDYGWYVVAIVAMFILFLLISD